MATCVRIYAAALLFLSLGSASALPDVEIVRPRSECAKGAHIIGIRGDSTDAPHPFGGLTPMIKGIEEKIPLSTNATVRYPKKQQGGGRVGEKNLLKEIKNHAAQCPDTPMILAGYSEGAGIIMNAICGKSVNPGVGVSHPLDPKYRQQIITANIYGDETRAADQPYNRGTCQTFGIFPRLNTQDCLPYADVIRSWCDSTDPICCVGGTQGPTHKEYGPKYDDNAIKFAARQYHKYSKG